MRTQEEIQQKIQELGAKLDENISYKERETIDVMLDVLENELQYEDIEEQYFDEHATNREQDANMAREWLDGEIEELDF
jgi:hypothetical protein